MPNRHEAARVRSPVNMTHQGRKSIALNQPLVVGIVADRPTLEAVRDQATRKPCDLLEFRIDALVDLVEDAEEAIQQMDLPVLITVRDPAEGGENGLTADERNALFKRFLPHASAVDVELRNFFASRGTIEAARNQQSLVVGSFHDFESFPEDTIRKILRQPPAADILKIAVTLSSEAELDSLLRALREIDVPVPTAFMGMGSLGPESRRHALEAGSILNYGYIIEPNAPGQLSAQQLRELIDSRVDS